MVNLPKTLTVSVKFYIFIFLEDKVVELFDGAKGLKI